MTEFVQTVQDLELNLKTFSGYRLGNKMEQEFYRNSIIKGRHFVCLEIDGAIEFGPSKFLGYKNMTMNRYEELRLTDLPDDVRLDGKKSTPVIERILGKSNFNQGLFDQFKAFCEKHSVDFNFNRNQRYINFFGSSPTIDKLAPQQNLIARYKQIIKKTELKDEIYKWELLSKFSGRPNLNNEDILGEFKSIDYRNLIYAMGIAVLYHLARVRPGELRDCLSDLFNEDLDLQQRILAYNSNTLKLYREIGETLQHHQDERTIATLLAYKFPNKYPIYKYSFYSKYCKLIGENKAGKNRKYVHYTRLIQEFIDEFISKDRELIDLVKKFNPVYYDGSNHLLLAQDILYQTMDGARDEEDEDLKSEINYWVYAPGESASMWNEFYDNGVMALGWDELGDLSEYDSKESIEIELQKFGNTESSKRNDATANWEFVNEMDEGDIVIVKRGRRELLGYGVVSSDYQFEPSEPNYRSRREVNWKQKGEWFLDFDLAVKTLTKITHYKTEDPNFDTFYERLLAVFKSDKTSQKVEKVMAKNEILFGPPGTGKTYKLKSEYFGNYTSRESELTKEQFFNDQIINLAWWEVAALALYECGGRAKVASLLENRWIQAKSAISENNSVRATVWGMLQMHTPIDSITVAYKQRLAPYIFNKNQDSTWMLLNEPWQEQCAHLIEIKSQVDSFTSSGKTIERYVFTTFHQSYSYEDFIEGIKPVMKEGETELAYAIESGVFKRLCERAIADPEHRYAIFIDEINRGNIANIFGELITLIEHDKRKGAANEMFATLPYSKKKFSVPNNVDIYGTMNTADRSVEALDTALRRRFGFVEMPPKPELIEEVGNRFVDDINLVTLLETMNKRIEKLLDKDHQIGHSYFLDISDVDGLKLAFKDKIIPLLQEYFFGDYGKIGLVLGSSFVKADEKEFIGFAGFNYDDGVQDDLMSRKVYSITPEKDWDFKSIYSKAN